MGGWGSRTHRPLGFKYDSPPGGILMTCTVASLREGEVHLQGEPIRLQVWPQENSEREEGMFKQYHCIMKLATSSVRLGVTNRHAQGH